MNIWYSKYAEKAPAGYVLAHDLDSVMDLMAVNLIENLHIDITAFWCDKTVSYASWPDDLAQLRNWIVKSRKYPKSISTYPNHTGFSYPTTEVSIMEKKINDAFQKALKEKQ